MRFEINNVRIIDSAGHYGCKRKFVIALKLISACSKAFKIEHDRVVARR